MEDRFMDDAQRYRRDIDSGRQREGDYVRDHGGSGAGRPYSDYGRSGGARGTWGVPFWGYPGGYGPLDYGRTPDWQEGHRGHERHFWDRASDEIASWFGDDAAQERRNRDHRGRGPQGYRRSDERILEDVNESLTDDSMVDAWDIEVSVANREVTLDGYVASGREKRRAEDCAEDVMGVEHVQNNLRVRKS